MKTCPQCKKTYSDETLNFCLEDGSVLTQTQEASSTEDSAATVVMNQQSQENQPAPTQHFGGQSTQQNWNTPSYQSNDTGSSSKSWLWALGIIFAVIILCGGGFVGIALLIPDDTIVDGNPTPTPTNSSPNPTPAKTNDTRKVVDSIDFAKWNINESEYITADYKNGELLLTSKSGYYYVILTKKFKTYNASTVLTVRNPVEKPAKLGYGLVIHSEPTNVLSKDYAFLIRGDTRQYRVVRHTNKRESNIVPWTRSSAIKGGESLNEIEVRVKNSAMNLYINGEFVRTVKDYTGYKDGVAGIYTSDDVPVGFQKIEIKE